MSPLTYKSHVGKDHILKLELPDEYSDCPVLVVVQPVRSEKRSEDEPRDSNGYPIGFLDRTSGKWVGPFERAPQGEYEIREEFN